jgi:hypothetical protein
MADKLKTLMGILPRQYAVSFANVPSGTLAVPLGMGSAAGLAPAANTWLTVINVTGSGRLRGAVLVIEPASYGSGYAASLRITVDGVAYVGSVTLGASGAAYVFLAEMKIGPDLCLLPELPFSSSLKIEVMRNHSTVPSMVLNHFYQLEA